MSFASYLRGGKSPMAHCAARKPKRASLAIEHLENRLTPSVSSAFDLTTGLLIVASNLANDAITLSSDTTGKILLTANGTIRDIVGLPTLTTTKVISVFGTGGNDTVTHDLSAITGRVTLDGGTGRDTLVEPLSGFLALTDSMPMGSNTPTLSGFEIFKPAGCAARDLVCRGYNTGADHLFSEGADRPIEVEFADSQPTDYVDERSPVLECGEFVRCGYSELTWLEAGEDSGHVGDVNLVKSRDLANDTPTSHATGSFGTRSGLSKNSKPGGRVRQWWGLRDYHNETVTHFEREPTWLTRAK